MHRLEQRDLWNIKDFLRLFSYDFHKSKVIDSIFFVLTKGMSYTMILICKIDKNKKFENIFYFSDLLSDQLRD